MFRGGLLLRLLAEQETEEPLTLGLRHGARVLDVHQAALAVTKSSIRAPRTSAMVASVSTSGRRWPFS